MTKDLEYINSDLALSQLCEQLQKVSWLAVDTEFERSSTYYPELCLLQIASRERVAVIDPLSIGNIESLYDVLYDTTITKVFHSARQDLELFYHIKGKIPGPIFDTQIAALLQGHADQKGYANLVMEILGVELEKSQTRTNWKRRPLTRKQLDYAADDVIYLAKLYEVMLPGITESGLSSAMTEECQALERSELYEPDPENMWRKIRAAKRITGNSLLVLKKLAAWRERTAREENQPRKWILPDHTLIDMTRLLPVNLDDLSQVKDMNKRVLKLHGAVLLDIIKEAVLVSC